MKYCRYTAYNHKKHLSFIHKTHNRHIFGDVFEVIVRELFGFNQISFYSEGEESGISGGLSLGGGGGGRVLLV